MRTWKVSVAAAAFMLGLGAAGCAGVSPGRKATDLETRISELEAANAELRRQFDEVNTRLQMLQARTSIAPPAVSSSAALPPGNRDTPPNLEIVKLKPAAPAPAATHAPASTHAPTVTPKPLSSWPQQPVFKTANGKTISLPKAAEPAPEPGATPAAAPAAPLKPGDQSFATYQDAMQLYDDKKYPEALVKFQQLSEDPKTGDLHDNARYWMGECYLAQSDFQKAVEEFVKLANDFPESDKAPDALYQAGLAYEELNQREPALETLREVVVLYPFSDSARLAEAKIKEWSR
jgi:tol-pal system protein YbgF